MLKEFSISWTVSKFELDIFVSLEFIEIFPKVNV